MLIKKKKKSLGAEETNWLERPLEDEVHEVVKTLNGDKALGLNNYTTLFFPSIF